MFDSKERCVNPWFGFLIILLICIMISAAIFFEFKGGRHTAKSHLKTTPKRGAMQVAFPNAVNDADNSGNKFVF